MVSFVQQTIFFLAGVSLTVSVPAFNFPKTLNPISSNREEIQVSKTENQIPTDISQVNLSDPNALGIIDAVTSVEELTEDQKIKLQEPLAKLIQRFDGTLFGALFSYIMNKLQNPTGLSASELNEAELLKTSPLDFESFLSTLLQLDDKVIQDSKTEFDEIFEILGNAKFATFFREIFDTLKKRQVVFQYAKMGDAMLKNFPNMLADVQKLGSEDIQKLIQNPEAMAALMPNLPGMQNPNPVEAQTPQKIGSKMPSSPMDLTPPAETLNTAKSIASRVRFNPGVKIGVPRTTSIQQRMEGLPTYRPAFLEQLPQGSMSV